MGKVKEFEQELYVAGKKTDLKMQKTTIKIVHNFDSSDQFKKIVSLASDYKVKEIKLILDDFSQEEREKGYEIYINKLKDKTNIA